MAEIADAEMAEVEKAGDEIVRILDGFCETWRHLVLYHVESYYCLRCGLRHSTRGDRCYCTLD